MARYGLNIKKIPTNMKLVDDARFYNVETKGIRCSQILITK